MFSKWAQTCGILGEVIQQKTSNWSSDHICEKEEKKTPFKHKCCFKKGWPFMVWKWNNVSLFALHICLYFQTKSTSVESFLALLLDSAPILTTTNVLIIFIYQIPIKTWKVKIFTTFCSTSLKASFSGNWRIPPLLKAKASKKCQTGSCCNLKFPWIWAEFQVYCVAFQAFYYLRWRTFSCPLGDSRAVSR